MAKDKYDFILNLLENKKLDPIQKERVLRLSILETKKDVEKKDIELLKRIEDIENKLEVEKNQSLEISQQNQEEKGGKKPFPKPKDTYEFLSFFSSTDGGLKNLTHSFDFRFVDYEELINKCKEEFEYGKQKFPNVPDPLLKRIENFVFSESPNWYIRRGDEIIVKKVGWSEPEFVKWYKLNKTHPCKDAFYGSEMITPFKETIQVRSDLGNLTRLIKELSDKVFQRQINLRIMESIHTAQFYTDVDRLGLAIYHIFLTIKQAALKNFCDEVEIDFEIQNGTKVLKIIHLDSTPTKSVHDFDFLGGDLNSVKNYLAGLCSYDILAKFNEGEYRMVVLTENLNELKKNKLTGNYIGESYKLEYKTKGFTHVLKFY